MIKTISNRKANQNINFSKWVIAYDTVGFGHPGYYETTGWFGEYYNRIKSIKTFENKHKIWLYLVLVFAVERENLEKATYSKTDKTYSRFLINNPTYKELFLDNYFEGAKKVILFTDIALSNTKNIGLFSSMHFPVKRIVNHPKYWEFLDFKVWEKYGIYKKKHKDIFKEDFDKIFSDLWRKVCIEEKRASIDIRKFGDVFYELSEIVRELFDGKTKATDTKYKARLLETIEYMNNLLGQYFRIKSSSLHSLIINFIISLRDELCKRHLTISCNNCNHLFIHKKKKKYCSTKCSKHFHYKIYYPKKRKKIISAAYKYNKEYREIKKYYNIKK